MSPPQIVLIPGLMNDADLWRDQVSGLKDIAKPRVADITKGNTLAVLAEMVLATSADTFALAGFSLGGLVAQEVMRRAPERITHLALLDTTMLPDTPERAAEREALVAQAKKPGRFHGFGRKLARSYLSPVNQSNEDLIGRVRAMTERLGPEVFIRQTRIERPDSRASLTRIPCPTLVLCGRHDVLTPPSLHEDMARRIPGAELVILEESGHLTPIEEPDKVTASLRALLRRGTEPNARIAEASSET
ncbi:alpha/beta fold hydrolase [Roseibium sediminicola]|uniref:Alpha/beta hydrolase n=1 Tax=Roseibium sediminicola TaxID=2933272 RepID=A0ABT0GZJ4_9HYPH|nr:alpha/beta fold hydrolase [Roseibium sp. CAU 1639]MCK7614849.1 alpha/beta hydrolase [Roseibium sp. CAU 1639]